MLYTLAIAALSFSAEPTSFTDVCASASDCTDCIAKVSQGCGWCAPHEVVYSDGTKGARCANAHDPKKWFCLGKLQTDSCIEGYVCAGAPSYQCVLSGKPGEGTTDLHACIDGCSRPPKWKCNSGENKCEVCTDAERDVNPSCMDNVNTCNDQCVVAKTYKCDATQGACTECTSSDDPSVCKGKSECDGTCTAAFECQYPTDPITSQTNPQCVPCTDPKGKGCYSTKAECQNGDGQQNFGCNWQYECKFNSNGPTCSKTAHGIPKLEWCEQQCKPTYSCDEEAMMCKLQNATGGMTNKTACDAGCPATPQNATTPFQLRGVWRGFAIEQAYEVGEWQANISANATEVIAPDGSVYFSGLTSTKAPTAQSKGVGLLLVNSTKGKLIGTVKLIYSDYGLEPELQYVALALDESHAATPPATYDAAMVAASNRVLGMYKCKSDGQNCKFHLATGVKAQAHLTWTRGMSLSLLDKYTEPAAVTGDKCNAFSSCATCIGATAGALACGWCTEPVIYGNASAAPKFQCAGWEAGQSHGWKCYGQFRTATCTDYCCGAGENGGCGACPTGKSGFPTKQMCDASCAPTPPSDFPCDFDGIYRGLEIDLGYQEGEWLAHFNKSSGNATFKYSGFRTHAGSYSYAGALRCTPESDKVPLAQGGTFSLKLTNGTVLYGRYVAGGNQAETEGLNWALGELGSTIPPFSFDSAMLGVNATVYGYTKCASYKAGVCKFHL